MTLAPLRVLIIDAVRDNCDMYEHALIQEGAFVVCAYDGEQGLDLAQITQPDVIVLDLGLPKMDGWEVARRLRTDDATRDVAIVVCTAHATEDAQARAPDGNRRLPCEALFPTHPGHRDSQPSRAVGRASAGPWGRTPGVRW